ncbi:uncharacterized protein LOC143184137 isoform X2 [Calliopsis andreniformis]|uniref:uncharacterized protein LOC143184137 isoform X2 n=1 Tax=Calliopsis andreniformis TaxID=337506 RepID=UPI003FCEB678
MIIIMTMWTLSCLHILTISVLCLSIGPTSAERNEWNYNQNAQYHIQTDEGPERYFRFQTLNGQYRKEKRLVDGTVIGTEGWLDPLGYLRLKDYVADDNGFRILRSKMIYVGKDTPIYHAVKQAEKSPAQTGILVQPTRPPNPFRQSETSNVVPLIGNDINSDYYVSTTARPRVDVSPVPTSNSNYYNLNRVNVQPYNTANGFEYYLKRQYHEEEQDRGGNSVGSFGYIDPFGALNDAENLQGLFEYYSFGAILNCFVI